MTEALIWALALGGAVAVFIVACAIAWACIQEFKND
jgi:hypothetical protein